MDHVLQSGYLERMTQSDKIARGLSHVNLVKHYTTAIVPFSSSENAIIDLLRTRLITVLRAKWPRALDIEYECVKIIGIENDFPHTHGNCIFLPERLFAQPFDRLFKTFVHEFVHVYQRTRPLDTHALVSAWGFKPTGHREHYASRYNMRLNPDVNELIYQNSTGNIEVMVYNSITPESLLDTHNVVIHQNGDVMETSADCRTEHPYEMMAYTLADVLVDNVNEPMSKTWIR